MVNPQKPEMVFEDFFMKGGVKEWPKVKRNVR